MVFKVITLFPEFIKSLFSYSIIGRALKNELVKLEIYDLHDWGLGSYKQVDDKPYGGGAGMLLMIEPIYNALKEIREKDDRVILLSARGTLFSSAKAQKLSKESIILICGHYEGVDERVYKLVDDVISIGTFVLSGGELAAMVIIDAVSRLIPGVIKKESLQEETNDNYIEYPQYTRPANFHGLKVPDVLLSGDHAKIKEWRAQHTKKR